MAGRTPEATRARGEHFLVAGPAVAAVLGAAAVRPKEHALDVGAGAGALTLPLAAAAGPEGKVVAIEKDPRWAARLRAAAPPQVQVVEGDALKVRLPARIDAVVANPPFRILPGLLRRLLGHGFGRAALVVPQELADRLLAAPEAERYGKLTVEVALRAKARQVGRIPRRAFVPRPEVDCALLRLDPKPAQSVPPAAALALLDGVLEAAWEARKRTLRHALAPMAAQLGLPPQAVSDALEATQVRDRTFAEVSPWEYGQLATRLAEALERAAAPGPR